jgi:hypothetical protein
MFFNFIILRLIFPRHRVVERLFPEKRAKLLVGPVLCHIDREQVIFELEVIPGIAVVPNEALFEKVLIIELVLGSALSDLGVVEPAFPNIRMLL